MSHALLKIYGVPLNRGHGGRGLRHLLREGPAPEQAVHVGLELDLQMILIDPDLPDDELEIVPL